MKPILTFIFLFSSAAEALTCGACGPRVVHSLPRLPITDTVVAAENDAATEATFILVQGLPELRPNALAPPESRAPQPNPPAPAPRMRQQRPCSAGQGTPVAICEYFNAWRGNKGLPALWLDPRLTQVAQAYARKIHADQQIYGPNYLSHDDENGGFEQRVAAAGIQFWALAENIASGQTTIQEVFESWEQSPGHRGNMMNAEFTKQGFGYYEGRWVHLFMRD